MDRADELLELLCENARYSTADLARLTDSDEDEVEATIEELEAEGIIQGYTAVVDWDAAGDERVRAHVELNVTLDRETSYRDVAERLAGFSEIQDLRLVSGDYDFALEVEGENMREVSKFISDKVAPVPEITQTVTHYIMENYKQGGYRFDDDTDDDRLSVTP
ncbi:Lrp/AsnC family transcription regulator [Natronomonas pharaonis DSM 2160]|uniref:Lrp/AsnC family transcription regulator n=1 Tax=Natronomonas pharaonis (strain ATCC 35678 / DSM 2160 / CIP 103997 / JCM 8858 / NBRC 14720 / NCIMB 2260 / Gabara) TaxID=348780 RepID=A0A1U7EY19_NATPD|nr:Lrp/AsnC family transcriptional regulator [Natronomonas pharaonis]CAI50104.1 Lrp/AsnC family transcription regulator [Natronomonas pharaonis DSM 2160]